MAEQHSVIMATSSEVKTYKVIAEIMEIIGIIAVIAFNAGIGLFAGWFASKICKAQEEASQKLQNSW